MKKERKIKEKTRGEIDGLALVWKIGMAITSTLDLKKVLNLIVHSAREAVKAQASTLRLLDKNKRELILVASRGVSLEHQKKGPVRIGESISGLAVKRQKPEAVYDVTKDKRYQTPAYARKIGLQSLLSVPLIIKGKSLGVLSVYTRQRHHFTQREIKMMSLFASQAAVAIENARLFERIEDSYVQMIRALGAMVDTFDWHTERHSEKVKNYAVAIARELDLSEEDIKGIEYAAYIHDIGKVGVDINILRKAGSLNDEEWIQITKHPILGAEMIEKLKSLRPLVPMVRHHHEKYAGHGYPDGLKGQAIPLGARILTVADAFEAMTADRPYRPAFPKKKAINEIKKLSGRQFDPEVVQAFLKVIEEEIF